VTPEEVARRYADRPGYSLVSYGEVGLPIWKISLRAEVLEHKQIDAFSEFALRAVAIGIDDVGDMRRLLGLHDRVTKATLVGLLGSDDLLNGARPGESATSLVLTPKGRRTLDTAISIVPEETVIEIDYDGLLRKPVSFIERWLTPFELKEIGAREVPPARVRAPELDQLDLAAVDAVIRRLGAKRHAKRELLALKAIERRRRVFQRAVILVYRAEDGPEVQTAFAIDGRLSEEHEQAFARADLARKLGILADKRPASTEPLPEPVRILVERALQDEAAEQLGAETVTEGATVPPEPVVTALATYDHPEFLQRALHVANDRLLIISPWITRVVVDSNFLAELRNRLDDGVDVFIGWGIAKLDQPDKDIDPSVKLEFDRLKKRYPYTFRPQRLGTTHSKVLALDQSFVIHTSFNWLSFKGDPKRTYRDEHGFLVRNAQIIDDAFEEWKPRFESDGIQT
jgi:hypothetical protein